jgi:hypothetical protein
VLLSAGADVDLPWASGSLAGASPLQTAASCGKVEALKLLIGALLMGYGCDAGAAARALGCIACVYVL